MRTPQVIRTEFSLTIRVRFISSMRKITNNYPDFVLITEITLFFDVGEFFLTSKMSASFFFDVNLSARYPLPLTVWFDFHSKKQISN